MFPLEWKGLVPSWHKPLESLKASTAPNHLNMTDFPTGGDAETTRAWLSEQNFPEELLEGWEADAILGKEPAFIRSQFSNDVHGHGAADRLLRLLVIARQSTGIICTYQLLSSLLGVFIHTFFRCCEAIFLSAASNYSSRCGFPCVDLFQPW
jgi:hypothetical protein